MSVTTNETEIVKTNISEDEFIHQAEANEGFKQDESVIPFTRILQPLSDLTAPGAQPGMLMNLANYRLTDGKKGMTIVPVFHNWNYTEWLPERGGFVKSWGEDEAGWQALCEPDQRIAYQPVTKSGNSILKARHFFILSIFEDGVIEPSILPFAATSLKVARQWSSLMSNAPKISTSKGMMVPAYFYYLYQLTTEHIKKGTFNWYAPKIQFITDNGKACSVIDLANGKQIWDMAIAFRDGFKAGTIRAAEVEGDAATDTY